MTYSESTAEYTMKEVLRALDDTAADLRSRAAEVKDFTDKVRAALEQDRAVNLKAFVSPRSAFFANVQRVFDDAVRSSRSDQSRTGALNSLVAAYGLQFDNE